MPQLAMPPAPPGFYNPPGTNIFTPDPSSTSTFTPSPPEPAPSTELTCLITVGATAPFRALVFAALTPTFLSALKTHNFRRLLIQAGTTFSDPEFQSSLSSASTDELVILAFDFHPTLATTHISAAEVVVSHAGAGSILDALRWGKKLVVVENTALMAGHQRELIEELQGQGYLLEGRVEELGKVVEKVMVVERVKGMGTGGKGIVGVLEEEMGIMKEG